MPRKPMPWFRFYTETITDRKIRRLPPAQRWVWAAVMAAARESPVPGRLMVTETLPMTVGELADYADVREREVIAAVGEMQRLVMMHWDGDVMVITNWEKRQPDSDNVTARSQKHREKVSRNGVATLQQQSTQQVRNEPEVETEVEKELTTVERGGGSPVLRESQTPPQTRPSENCPAHPRGTTDACGPCGRAKRAAADYDAEQRRIQSLAVSQAAKERAQMLRVEVDRCQLCDPAGYRLGADGQPGILRCDHIDRQPGALARARAATAQPETRTAP